MNGYPTFALFPACAKQRVAVYTGALNVHPLLAWMRDHQGTCSPNRPLLTVAD